MARIELKIVNPQHGQRIVGALPTDFEGMLKSVGHGQLFYKWYSSLHSPPQDDPTNAAMRVFTESPCAFSDQLSVGTHVITFVAKDREPDTLDEIKNVQHAGMSGGPEDAESPCIIHVFIANMLVPFNPGATLSKANSTLIAEAPAIWGIEEPNSPEHYVPNEDYHKVNRIHYSWLFEPQGVPEGRPSCRFSPEVEAYSFDPAGEILADVSYQGPLIQYEGPLPAELETGGYTLTLRAEDIHDNSVRHGSAPLQIEVAE